MQMNEQRGIVCGVIILAAGASSRMGRPKMLLPWGATSVLGHLIGQWQTLGGRTNCRSVRRWRFSRARRIAAPWLSLDHCILNPTPSQACSVPFNAPPAGWLEPI